MIDIKELTHDDINRLVIYTPAHYASQPEQGRITSWNDLYIFVDYNNTGHGIATPPETLTFLTSIT